MSGLYTAWPVGSLYHCILVQGGSQEFADVQICVLLYGLIRKDPGAGPGVQGTWLTLVCAFYYWS